MSVRNKSWVAGVDGCRGGWFVVLVRCARSSKALQSLRFVLCERFCEVLNTRQAPAVMAVDIPIGLLDKPRSGGRDCDREARLILGRGRQSSVFTPPTRSALAARSYRQAIRLNGQGISRQAFGILGKIREVDRELNPARQHTVYEAHPELAFAGLAGAPMEKNKKTRPGRHDRERLLRRYYGRHYIEPALLRARFGLKRVAADDILDAYALAYTAVRIAAGNAARLPSGNLPRDAKRLRMEIWY